METALQFFLVLSLLVIIHELGHFFAAKLQGIKVEEFGFGIPPRIFGIRFGETIYTLNLLPFGGFVRVFGEEEEQLKGKKLTAEMKKRSFAHKKPWQKAIVLVAGVVLNFVLGWVVVSYLFTQDVPVPSDNVHIEAVSANSPAEDAGLQADDIITTIQHEDTIIEVDETDDIKVASEKYADTPIILTAIRGEETIFVEVVPRGNPPEGEGALGISISSYEIKKYSWTEAPFYGLVESARVTGLIAHEAGKIVVRLITFRGPGVEIAGPVGIAKLTGEAFDQGSTAVLQLIGILSLNLAVFNILPFPALDGGRLAFVIYEWVTGKKPNSKFEQRLNLVGFSLLIGLLILVTINDIAKLLG